MRVLISWIGGSDLKAEFWMKKKPDDYGPVLRLLREETFDQVYLLNDVPEDHQSPPASSPKRYLEWLCEQLRGVNPKQPDIQILSSPMNYRNNYVGAYDFTKGKINEIIQECYSKEPDARFACLLTPGYLPCQIAMLLASEGPFRTSVELFNTLSPEDELVKSGRTKLVERIKFPYSLKLDLLPQIVSRMHRPEYPRHPSFSRIVGESQAIRAAIQRAQLVAKKYPITVLLTGPTGTGKELFARAIHEATPWPNDTPGPFVAVNCGALSESLLESELFGHEKGAFTGAQQATDGKIQAADKGTLFLDEVGEMSLSLQTKLLRVLEQREVCRVGSNKPIPVTFRLVTATHRRLDRMMMEGTFREDLYYRLETIEICLPGLKDRGDDVRLIMESLMQSVNERYQTTKILTESAKEYLSSVSWPGNVRQLKNVLEKLVVLSGDENEITGETVADLAQTLAPRAPSTLTELGEDEFLSELAAVVDELLCRFRNMSGFPETEEMPRLWEDLLRPLLTGRSMNLTGHEKTEAGLMWLRAGLPFGKDKEKDKWGQSAFDIYTSRLEPRINPQVVATRRGKPS